MIPIDRKLIEEFAKSEFPGKSYAINDSYWYIQAGTCLGEELHYEYWENQVHLHIEGPNWRGIRDYLRDNVKEETVSSSRWGRNECCWTLNCVPQNWEEIKNAFRKISSIMNPYIHGYEETLAQAETLSNKTMEIKGKAVEAHFGRMKDVLSKNLVIPNYQRPYRWTTENVEQLLNDIQSSKNDRKLDYLLGTVILHRHNAEDKIADDIVDGQQRITTIVLLLKELRYNGPLPNLRYYHNDSYYHIKENHKFITRWLDMHVPDREAFLSYIKDNCSFVVITVTELSEAFQMFESQNGRGKELEPYNLLKAYHIRAMENEQQENKLLCDRRWEEAAMYSVYKNYRVDILRQLFNEQLYRTRLWSRGESAYWFTKKNIDEFKGVTLNNGDGINFAFQNIFLQQELANRLMKSIGSNLFKVKGRFLHGEGDNINPFVNINQLILNGKPFFDYVETYVELYKRLFLQLDSSQLSEFKDFYKKHCLYDGCGRIGDSYVREVYKSAILMVFDRFGEVGLYELYKDLYLCVYKYRLENKRVFYRTMANADKVAWIFQKIQRAINLSQLSCIKDKAQEALSVARNYEIKEVENVFDK